MEAKLPRNPVAPIKAARQHNLEAHHLPGAVEHEQGTELQPDLKEQFGHPGVACEDMPPGHVHPLPKLDSKHTHHKSGQDPETPPASPLAPSD